MVASLSIADLQMLQLLEGPLGGITNGPVTILAPAANVVPLTIKGFAGQSANLTEWQNSAGTILARFDNNGSLFANGLQDIGSGLGPFISMQSASVVVQNRTTVGNIPLEVIGMTGQTGALQYWLDSVGTILTFINSQGFLYVGGAGVTPGGQFGVTATAAGNRLIVIKEAVAQTGDPLQLLDSSAVVLARITAAGQGRFASLGVANSLAATVAVGALARKIEVFDAAGASLGFVPVYSTIT